jgi:hypothetical protein
MIDKMERMSIYLFDLYDDSKKNILEERNRKIAERRVKDIMGTLIENLNNFNLRIFKMKRRRSGRES